MTNDIKISRELIAVMRKTCKLSIRQWDELNAACAEPVVESQEPAAIVTSVISRKNKLFEIDILNNKSLTIGDQLYTSPPAPVAVVLDERAEFEAETLRQSPEADLERNPEGNYMNFYLECAWNGWQQRACLDKVKELNQ